MVWKGVLELVRDWEFKWEKSLDIWRQGFSEDMGFGQLLKNVGKWKVFEDDDMTKWQIWNMPGVQKTYGWSDGFGQV